MARQFYNKKDSEFSAGSANFASLIAEEYESLGLTIEQVDEYQSLDQAFQLAFRSALSSETRTSVAIADRNISRRSLHDCAQRLGQRIYAGINIDNAKLVALGLLPVHSRKRVNPPEGSPTVQLEKNDGRWVRLRIYDANSASRRSKPKGVLAAQIFACVSESAPTSPSQYRLQRFTTTAFVEITFPDSVPSGATIWISANWFNKRGEHGISSVPMHFTLQGGEIRAAA